LALAAVFGLGFSQPKWVADLGFDFPLLPELNQRMAEIYRKQAALDKKFSQLNEICSYKDQIVLDLIQGKLSLAQAGAKLLQVMDPVSLILVTDEFLLEKKSLRWRAYRVLIYWAKHQLWNDSPRAAEVCQRLEEELKALDYVEE
jgi:hypothetical protein